MEFVKAKSRETFIENQFLVLSQLEKTASLSGQEKPVPEQEKCREYTFMILLLSGQKGRITDGFLQFEHKKEGIPAVFSCPLASLEKYDFLTGYLEAAKKQDAEPDTDAGQEKAPETPAPASGEKEKTISSVSQAEAVLPVFGTEKIYEQMPETETGQVPAPETMTLSSGKEDSPGDLREAGNAGEEKGDTAEEKEDTSHLIFGKYLPETEDMPHAETEEYKYLDTMWFHHYHVTCSIKDGYMPEDFDFMVYPMQLTEERTPVMVAAGLKCRDHTKICFSEKNRFSIEMNYEDYVFAVTLRFLNGQLTSKLTLCSEQHEIFNLQQDCYQGDGIMPQHFHKQITFGKDVLEIYPLGLDNDEIFGCVDFMYRFIMETGEILTGVSDEEDYTLTLALSKGGAVKIYCYWDGEDAERRFVTRWD